jgi:hypothetical protein
VTWVVTWPVLRAYDVVDKHFLSYLTGRVLRDKQRVYSVHFVWYNDSIYFHPMIWGSLALYLVAQAGIVATGWLLLLWFIGMFLCYTTVMYNINVVRAAVLGVGVVAFLAGCYVSTAELAWNPLAAIGHHVREINATVTPGFFLASAYFFAALVVGELLWAWLFHRVEIDESYVYQHQFLKGCSRDPIFATELKRETKDLLELLLLGAADIQHRTKAGVRRYKNIPFASLWLGTAIDSLLDHRRRGEAALEHARNDDVGEDVRVVDAFPDAFEDEDGDDGGNEVFDIGLDDGHGCEDDFSG